MFVGHHFDKLSMGSESWEVFEKVKLLLGKFGEVEIFEILCWDLMGFGGVFFGLWDGHESLVFFGFVVLVLVIEISVATFDLIWYWCIPLILGILLIYWQLFID